MQGPQQPLQACRAHSSHMNSLHALSTAGRQSCRHGVGEWAGQACCLASLILWGKKLRWQVKHMPVLLWAGCSPVGQHSRLHVERCFAGVVGHKPAGHWAKLLLPAARARSCHSRRKATDGPPSLGQATPCRSGASACPAGHVRGSG